MTREERENALHCLKVMIDEEVCEECNLYGTTGTDHCEADCVRVAIKALEQEPCKDCVSRQAVDLLCFEFLKPNSDDNRAFYKHFCDLPSVQPKTEQEPCEDCISRKEIYFKLTNGAYSNETIEQFIDRLVKELEALPPVNPQESKTGHWIVDGSVDCYLDKVRCHCSECDKKKIFPADYNHVKQEISISYKYPELIDNYCPNCGAKMESEVEDEKID